MIKQAASIALLVCALTESSRAGDVMPLKGSAGPVAEFEQMKYGLFVCWSLQVVALGVDIPSKATEKGLDPRALLKPANWTPKHTDPAQWARVAREAGMKYAVLTAVHHYDGCFGLWDIPNYEYDVGSSPGKRDVVREFVKACVAEGIRPGIYLDGGAFFAQVAARSGVSVTQAIDNVIGDLLTKNPEIFLLWFDFGWKDGRAIYQAVKRHKPDCLVVQNLVQGARTFFDDGLLSVPADIGCIEFKLPDASKVRKQSIIDGQTYYLALESCKTAITSHWFWSEGSQPRDLAYLKQVYQDTTARGINLLLDVGPDPDGRIPQDVVTRLNELRDAVGLKPGVQPLSK